MQEYWESYIKPIDGHKAMVSFNASVADNVPNMEYLYVGFVKVKLRYPKSNGLVDDREMDDIGFIEDHLEMESLRWRVGKYIGRIISQGEVNFIYYLKLDFEWDSCVKSAMEYFKKYSYEFGSRMDMEWEVYQKLLFPDIEEWQMIANHHACDSLKEQGDDLLTQRAIEHKCYFKDQKSSKEFIELISEKGFKIQKEMEVPFRNDILFGVEFCRVDIPLYYDIDRLTIELIEISSRFDGQYDGWESSLVK